MGGGCSTRPRQRHGALRSSEGRTSGALRAAPPRARQRLDGGVRRMAARMEAGHREEAPSDAGSNSIQELQDRALVGVRRVAYAFGEAGIVCANVASTREGTPEGGVLKVFGLVLLGEPPVVPSLTHEHRSPGRGACASLRLGLNVVPNPVVHLLLNPETNDGSLRAHSSSDRPELCRTQVRTRS